jgi:hypothetical protein
METIESVWYYLSRSLAPLLWINLLALGSVAVVLFVSETPHGFEIFCITNIIGQLRSKPNQYSFQ